MTEPKFTFVAKTEDIPVYGMKCFDVDGRAVLVMNTAEDAYKAIENMCSHEKKPLDEGRVRGGKRIVCPHHGANFDLETGKALSAPAVLPITVFPLEVQNGNIFVKLVEAQARPVNPFAIPGAKGFTGGGV